MSDELMTRESMTAQVQESRAVVILQVVLGC